MMHTNAKAMAINDNDYSCHITAVDLFNQLYEVHIMPLVINSPGGGDTHTYRRLHRNNVKKPGARCGWRAPGLKKSAT